MTNNQWQWLIDIIDGKVSQQPPVGFIIDSPWLPGWCGVSTLQYYTSEKLWFEVNKRAVETFPDVLFLPGFWSEFGMCTEPSAFGSKMVWDQFNLPHADIVIRNIDEVKGLKTPNPKTDGLLPFVLQRLKNYHNPIREAGHEIKFAVARGPLNIASFLMGTTEFMMSLMLHPDEVSRFLHQITRFTIDWLQLQKETFPSIEGILILDDIVGFVGEAECVEYVVPLLKEIFNAFEAKVKFFHNDAQGLVSTPFLKEIGVNLFNFSHQHTLNEIRELAGNSIALLGNLPPRDVLAGGSPQEVEKGVVEMWDSINDKRRIIWSCGGGMPPGVTTLNIHSFIKALSTIT